MGFEMPTNTLTDAKCKAAKPADKPFKLFDGGGLFLFVAPGGLRSWRMAYRYQGKQKTIAFGPYPEVSLAEARKQRDAVKSSLRDAVDPMEQRRAARAGKSGGMTLAEATIRYWEGRKDVSPSYQSNAIRGIEKHLFPFIGKKPLADVSRDDLMAALNVMDAAGLHVYVRKVRMWVSQVFDWAVEQGLAGNNPAAGIRTEKAFGKAKVKSFAALELRDVPDFMARLSYEKDIQSVLACRLLAYTWVRTNELRMMEWSEIDESTATWLIPEGKMKRARDHVVPLPRQAMAILQAMKARCRGSAYVFPNERRIDRPLSENAILYLIGRMGYRGRMTGHGWRSVGSTWANENGYPPDAIERQLAHAPDDKVRSVYKASSKNNLNISDLFAKMEA